MQYRDLFPAGIDYVGADLPGNELAQVLLDDTGRVPLPDASFDLIFSTQVLEHVEEPDLYLAECRRLLKPGGRLLLSTHGTLIFHPCPNDYWRWTAPGLHRTIEKASFGVTTTQGVFGGMATALQFLQDTTAHKLPGFLRPLFFCAMQIMILLADRAYSPEGRIKNACCLIMTAQARN
jgi:SAM-dependent methyltransferase